MKAGAFLRGEPGFFINSELGPPVNARFRVTLSFHLFPSQIHMGKTAFKAPIVFGVPL
jgi:hypothetical protein